MNTINTRLAVIDALIYPALLAGFVLTRGDHIGGAHGMALVLIGIWAVRKLLWALDGYKDAGDSWVVFNPFNPVSVVLAGIYFLCRQDGPYSYTTTTLLIWGSAGLLMSGIAHLVR